ncbi:EpsG family protein [Salegentibacter echinorum]|uniref:EpsG family protein n=1 Tax=Salegentibacter echinorum TaxID=1073325 RepID=A0A1M5BVC6_SALEC|nr:EpsG family protein [Salegentibacter echinorum]SHF46395.1 EpsG family protein [Salegentibacter echinorum]
MLEFIPIEIYTPIYYHILLSVVLMTILHSQVLQINDKVNLVYVRSCGLILLIFVLGYMGLRPLSGIFTDMGLYAKYFFQIQEGNNFSLGEDFLFDLLLLITAYATNIDFFFLLCAGLYVIPLYLGSKKWFGGYWFYSFLFLVISFSFWNYGTNGIRNGIATSIFILGLSRENKRNQIILILVAVGFHKSMLLPAIAYAATFINNNPKVYLRFWLLCIPLSLFLGGYLESIITYLGFGDDRLSKYLTDEEFGANYNRGFRWDFLIYSAAGVFAGYYFIFKRKFKDNFYNHLFNIYLIANGFWILIIRASYSNRFAYLSWFLLGIIVVYPFLKEKLFVNQHQKLGGTLLVYFMFTYIMNVILA